MKSIVLLFSVLLFSFGCEKKNYVKLCGIYESKDATYEKFIFKDSNNLSYEAFGRTFQTKYLLEGDQLFIMHDKGFLEFKVDSNIQFKGTGAWVKGDVYQKNETETGNCSDYKADKELSGMLKAERYRKEGIIDLKIL